MIISKRIWTLFGLAVLTVVGCTDNPGIRMRYEAERRYHQAEKLLQDTSIRPELVDRNLRREIADQFGATADFCFNALETLDSEAHPVETRELRFLAYQAGSRLSQIMYRARRFDTCIAITSRLIERLDLRDSQAMTAYINLGRALQGDGQWDSALTVYDYAVEKFYPPVGDSAQVLFRLFNLPFHTYYIAQLVGDSSSAAFRWRDAEAYYMGLAEEYPQTPVGYAGYGMLARLYHETGQWEREAQILRKLMVPQDTAGVQSAKLRLADLYAGPIDHFDSAEAIYMEILDEASPSDSSVQPLVMFKLSQLALERDRYTRAREILREIEEEYPRFSEQTPAVQLTKAMTFEMEGNWDRAEAEYQLLIEKFRASNEALTSLLYLANRAKERGRDAQAERWYRAAEKHYTDLAQRRSGTLDEARALSFQATLLQQRDQWEAAAETLMRIYDRFPDAQPGHEALLSAARLYRNRLDNPQRADSLLETLRASLTEIKKGWL